VLDEAQQAFTDFVEKVKDLPDEVYMGIDPGNEGAIALLCKRTCTAVDIPVLKIAVKRSRKLTKKTRKPTHAPGQKTETYTGESVLFNYMAIVELMRVLKPVKDRVYVCLELAQVQNTSNTSKGKKFKPTPLTGYKVAWGCAMWPLYFASRGWPLEMPTPAQWKAAMGLGKDKEANRAKAIGMFPKAPLARKKDHNRAEAVLLAEYLKRLRQGQRKVK
jgi:hypothetical protein